MSTLCACSDLGQRMLQMPPCIGRRYTHTALVLDTRLQQGCDAATGRHCIEQLADMGPALWSDPRAAFAYCCGSSDGRHRSQLCWPGSSLATLSAGVPRPEAS